MDLTATLTLVGAGLHPTSVSSVHLEVGGMCGDVNNVPVSLGGAVVVSGAGQLAVTVAAGGGGIPAGSYVVCLSAAAAVAGSSVRVDSSSRLLLGFVFFLPAHFAFSLSSLFLAPPPISSQHPSPPSLPSSDCHSLRCL